MEHSGLCLMNSEVRFFLQAGRSYIQTPFLRCKMLVGIVPNPLCTASAGCRLRICAKCFYNEKKNTEDSPRAGAILGVLCLSGLHFFLGSLFFCEEHLDILLCFHQLLHLIPRLAIGRIGSFLLRKQCGVFCVQLFYLWQFFSVRLRQKRLLPPCAV